MFLKCFDNVSYTLPHSLTLSYPLTQDLVELFNFHNYDNLRHFAKKYDPRREGGDQRVRTRGAASCRIANCVHTRTPASCSKTDGGEATRVCCAFVLPYLY